MLIRLTLTNFMAHGRTVLDLGPGLTALVGPNNTGKSAVVEALRCLATNPAPRHFIRHGAKQATVAAEFSDGHRVVWLRKKASAGYHLYAPGADQPEEFWKLGRGGVPEEVQRVLRLNLVQLEDSGSGPALDVHLGNQREPVFLLNESPATMASFFAASTESVHLLHMQQALKGRVTDAKRNLRDANARLGRLEDELQSLADLPGLALRAEKLRQTRDELVQARQALPALQQAAATIGHARRESKRLALRAAALAQVKPAPQLIETRQLGRLQEHSMALRRRIRSTHARAGALAPLVAAPALFPAKHLAELLARQAFLRQRLGADQARQKALAPLREPPQAAPLRPLAELAARLEHLRRGKAALARKSAGFGDLPPPPQMQPLGPLAQLQHQISALRARQLRADEAARMADKKLREFEAGLQARLDAIGRCPTCGGKLEAGDIQQHLGGRHGA